MCVLLHVVVDHILPRKIHRYSGGASVRMNDIVITNNVLCRLHIAESLSTLKFGDRARTIQTKPQVNKALTASDEVNLKRVISKQGSEISVLKQTIVELQKELHSLKHSSFNSKQSQPLSDRISNDGEANSNTTNKEVLCSVCNTFINELNRVKPTSSQTAQTSQTNSPLPTYDVSFPHSPQTMKQNGRMRAKSLDNLTQLHVSCCAICLSTDVH